MYYDSIGQESTYIKQANMVVIRKGGILFFSLLRVLLKACAKNRLGGAGVIT